MSKPPRSIFEYLSDEAERPYLIAAMDGKLDDTGRLDYAQFLSNRDPVRAEWIRLEVKLHAQATDDADVHQRYTELGREVGYDFRRVMRRRNILNCGSAASEPRRVRFSFVCERKWETLHPTEDAAVRHCNSCDSRVYQCATVKEAEAHARAGHCIAVPLEIVHSGAARNYKNMLGRPDPIGDWAEKMFPEN
jgi:uncharacterized protein (TIGR02996 family)